MATATKKAKKIKLQPLNERVVVQRAESEEVTAGGIVLPDSAQDKPARGTVLAVGPGRILDDGSRGELQVKEGDVVETGSASEIFDNPQTDYTKTLISAALEHRATS